MSSQAVFLFDVNAYHENILHVNETLQKVIADVRLVCLRLLVHLSHQSKNFRFGVKFFNSKGDFGDEKDKNILFNVDLESFEILEKTISDRFGRYSEFSKKLSHQTRSFSRFVCTSSPVQLLSLALKEILCDFQWNSPEICSPVRNKRQTEDMRKNYIFLFAACPFDLSGAKESGPEKFQDCLMPTALYEKFVDEAGITLVWLNTMDGSTNDLTNSQMEIMSAVHNIKGKFIPLKIFALPDLSNIGSSLNDGVTLSQIKNNLSVFMNESLIVPFSILFSHYFEPLGVRHNENLLKCNLELSHHKTISIVLTPARINKFSLSKFTISNSQENLLHPCTKNAIKNSVPTAGQWCLFKVKKAIPKGFFGPPDFVYFCQSVEDASEVDNGVIWDVLRHFDSLDQFLVLQCESEDGHIAVGLLYAISTSTAVIAIYNSFSSLTRPKNSASSKQKNVYFYNLLDFLENFPQNTDVNSDDIGNDASVIQNNFLMSCFEPWFVPTSKASNVIKHLSMSKESKSFDENDTLKKLCAEYQKEAKKKRKRNIGSSPVRSSPRLKRQKTEENSQNFSQSLFALQDDFPLLDLDNLEKNKVNDFVQEVYVSAVEEVRPLYSSACSIVKSSMLYLKSLKGEVAKEDLLTYLSENIFADSKEIATKFMSVSDTASLTRKAREYQMQVLLHLEAEAVFSSETYNNSCANVVIALLRRMLFTVGHSEVTQFLQECIKVTYAENLHHILVEIEEELDVPIFRNSRPSSPFGDLSPDNYNTKSSILSFDSVPSCRSSSSVSSQRDSNSVKRPFLSQGALADNFHKRQIMVPRKLLKTQTEMMFKSQPSVQRRSPRISSRLVRSAKVSDATNQKTPRKVRRNLFCTAQTPKSNSPSPLKSRRKQLTPKGRHVLKTAYVPETPLHKQGHSAVRMRQEKLRRSSGVASNEVQQVVESPRYSKKIKEDSILDSKQKIVMKEKLSNDAQEEHGKKLTTSARKKRWSFNGPSSSPLQKDFIRRCSKRLFQNNTPPPKGLPHSPQKPATSCEVVIKDVLEKTPLKQSQSTRSSQNLHKLSFVPKRILNTPPKCKPPFAEQEKDNVILSCSDDQSTISIPKLNFFGNSSNSESCKLVSNLKPPVLEKKDSFPRTRSFI